MHIQILKEHCEPLKAWEYIPLTEPLVDVPPTGILVRLEVCDGRLSRRRMAGREDVGRFQYESDGPEGT
jgi:hypothetical protein